MEPAGGETAADDPPNGTGESLTSIDETSKGVIRRRPSFVLVSTCFCRTLAGSVGLFVIGLVKKLVPWGLALLVPFTADDSCFVGVPVEDTKGGGGAEGLLVLASVCCFMMCLC